MMPLSPHSALRQQFLEEGYLALQSLFPEEQLRELQQEVARFLREAVPTLPNTQVYYEDKQDPSTLKQVQKLFEHDAFFQKLMLEGPIRELAETVLEDDVRPVNLQYFNKPPGVGKGTPPHQDGYYFHLSPCEAVTGWLALDAVDEENGCLHYVRGSHRAKELRPHGPTQLLGFSQGITDFGTEADRAGDVALPGAAGTFLLHHAQTIHWAGPNRSATRPRRALGFIYYAQRAQVDQQAQEAYQQALDARLTQTQQI